MRQTRTVQTSIFDIYSEHERGQHFRALSDLLDQNPELIKLAEKDLLNEEAETTGSNGMSVESVFRCMLIKQITGASYRELSFMLSDSPTYRAFARLDRDNHPCKAALCSNIRRLRPETLQLIFEQLALNTWEQGELKTDTMRLDSTVVKSNIAAPSDSKLLDDGIRVLSRLFAKCGDCTGVKLRLTDYRKDSRQLAAAIFYGKKAEKEALYPEQLALAKKVIKQSDRAIDQVNLNSKDALASAWVENVLHYRGLLEKVIEQTERRVINGEKVPAAEKIVSLFEPHTDIIVKSGRGVDYGHKINLSSNEHGFITMLMLEDGNPKDSERFIPLLEGHQKLYGHVPTTTIADGCYASLDNIESAKEMGVQKVAFHKKNGIPVSAMGIKEKTLKKLKDFRAGVEANISELKRAFGAGKATWKGASGFAAYVWASVISYNLTHLLRLNSG